jgi:hypothetical protein
MPSNLVPIALCSIAAVWFCVAVAQRHFSYKRAAKQKQNAHDARIAALRTNLLLKTLNDEGKVDRLIWLEREKAGNLPLETLMESAIERWEKDNR